MSKRAAAVADAPSANKPWPAAEVAMRPVNDLVFYARNARTHSDRQVDQLAASIREFGWTIPVLVAEDNTVIAGHGRLMAAKKLGITEAPVMVAKGWSEAQRRAYVIADNQLTLRGGWDEELLKVELDDLNDLDFDLTLTGFEMDEIKDLLTEPEPDADPEGQGLADDAGMDALDKADELQAKWQVKVGDLWTLGDHKIICGDCTDPAVIGRLMGDDRADICWTDPPWNVAYGENLPSGNNALGWKPRTILNDSLGDKFPAFCASFCQIIHDFVKPGAPLYMAMSAQEWPIIHAALSAVGFHWSSSIIWAKDSLVVSRKDYHTQYEPVWYGWRDDAARLCPVEDRKQSDLWHIPRPKRSDFHPTTKPIALVERALQNSSKPRDLVFEPFSGSGTTLIAAARTNRIARASELAEKYVSVALERWSEMTGGTPVLERNHDGAS
jgi:DNA modification methylase